MATQAEQIQALKTAWETESRWADIVRPYTAEEVVKLRPSVNIEYSLAKAGAEKLWDIVHNQHRLNALGCLTGG